MGFRALVKQGWLIRTVDVVGHILFGWILGSIVCQLLPDILLPIIWFRSWKTDELLPETDFILQLHRLSHTLYPSFLAFAGYVALGKIWLFWVSAQFFVHVVWDKVTHPEPEFKKSLWGL